MKPTRTRRERAPSSAADTDDPCHSVAAQRGDETKSRTRKRFPIDSGWPAGCFGAAAMKHLLSSRGAKSVIITALALAGALAACEDGPTGPAPNGLYRGYFLSTVNGNPLPTATPDLPVGFTLVASQLSFPNPASQTRPRGGRPILGFVAYTQVLRDGQGIDHPSTVQLGYTVSEGELRINLCPPFALCIAPTELVGPVDGTELLLTHYLSNQARSVYRFVASLPD